jgi:urease accessory protein
MCMVRAVVTTMTTITTDPVVAMKRVAAPPPQSAALSAHALLHLMWLASPALPVGGFSYSEGLEAAVDSGRVSNEAQASLWLQDQLQLSLARCELAVVAQAFDAWSTPELLCQTADTITSVRAEPVKAQVSRTTLRQAQGERLNTPRADSIERLQALNHWVLATRESSEFRQQTQQMGRSLAEWLKNQTVTDEHGGEPDPRVQQLAELHPSPTWPVAFALAAQQTGAPVREALMTMAFGWAENMVQAALKAVPLGQSAGQRVLAALCAQIPAAVEQALNLHDDDRQAHSPMLAILSAQHETQYSRLFRS